MPSTTIGDRIRELDSYHRGRAELLYGRTKLLVIVGVALVIVPAIVLVAVVPNPGVPSASHVLPLELYVVCFGVGCGVIAAGYRSLLGVHRLVDLYHGRAGPGLPPNQI